MSAIQDGDAIQKQIPAQPGQTGAAAEGFQDSVAAQKPEMGAKKSLSAQNNWKLITDRLMESAPKPVTLPGRNQNITATVRGDVAGVFVLNAGNKAENKVEDVDGVTVKNTSLSSQPGRAVRGTRNGGTRNGNVEALGRRQPIAGQAPINPAPREAGIDGNQNVTVHVDGDVVGTVIINTGNDAKNSVHEVGEHSFKNSWVGDHAAHPAIENEEGRDVGHSIILLTHETLNVVHNFPVLAPHGVAPHAVAQHGVNEENHALPRDAAFRNLDRHPPAQTLARPQDAINAQTGVLDAIGIAGRQSYNFVTHSTSHMVNATVGTATNAANSLYNAINNNITVGGIGTVAKNAALAARDGAALYGLQRAIMG